MAFTSLVLLAIIAFVAIVIVAGIIVLVASKK